jgi:hypothetical protein
MAACRGDRLDALEKIASHLPLGIAGPPGSERTIRLLKLLNVTAVERASLRGEL